MTLHAFSMTQQQVLPIPNAYRPVLLSSNGHLEFLLFQIRIFRTLVFQNYHIHHFTFV